MADETKTADTQDNSVTVQVFVPCGRVAANDIRKAALQQAIDDIPPAAYNVKFDMDASDVKTVEGQEGRDYTVKISYTPRGKHSGESLPGTVAAVEAGLAPLTPERVADAVAAGGEA